jgi:hypothetical protein
MYAQTLGGSNIVAIVMRGNGDGKILSSCYGHVMTTGWLCKSVQWCSV